MRCLQVIDSMHLAGAETMLLQIVEEMVTRGIDCSVYVLNPDQTPLLDTLNALGVPVHTGPSRNVYHPRQAIALRDHLRIHEYDLVHVHLFPAQLWVPIACILSRVRPVLVTTEHSTNNRRRTPLLKWLDAWMYRNYDRILHISDATFLALTDWLPSVRDKSVLTPNGINLGRCYEAEKIPRDVVVGSWTGTLAMFTARFTPQKDHDTLLKAVARVPDLGLILVGDGTGRPEVERLAVQLGIESRVFFLGSRSDVPSLLKSVDIYVHISRWEGFGLAVVEAMACGCPVIASRVPGLTEVVADAGLQVDPGDVDQLVEALKRLIHNPDLQTRFRVQGQTRAQLFSIEQTVSRYLEVYRVLLK